MASSFTGSFSFDGVEMRSEMGGLSGMSMKDTTSQLDTPEQRLETTISLVPTRIYSRKKHLSAAMISTIQQDDAHRPIPVRCSQHIQRGQRRPFCKPHDHSDNGQWRRYAYVGQIGQNIAEWYPKRRTCFRGEQARRRLELEAVQAVWRQSVELIPKKSRQRFCSHCST